MLALVLEFRLLRFEAPKDASSAPLITAATAAMLAALVVMLLRRVTLWAGLSVPRDTECEWCRDAEWRIGRLEEGVEDTESRCWLRGREGWGSYTALVSNSPVFGHDHSDVYLG